MMPKPQLSRIARNGVQELRRDHGVEPDLSEILWLHELGKRVENPNGAGNLEHIGIPVRAGKVYLWRFTVSSSSWFNELALKWFEGDPATLFFAMCFALVHGRGDPLPEPAGRGWLERLVCSLSGVHNEKTLADLRTKEDASRAVKVWRRRCYATREELEEALDVILGEPSKSPKGTTQAVDWGQIVKDLAIMTNTDPEKWVTKQGLDDLAYAYVRAVITERARRGEAGGKAKTDADRALDDFRKAITAIIEAHSEPKDDEGASDG